MKQATGKFVVREVNLASLSDMAHEEYLAFQNRMRAESSPDDPPRTIEDHLSRRRNVPPFIELRNWEVRSINGSNNSSSSDADAPLAGLAELQIAHQQTNQNLASFDLWVLPEHRCVGIARSLLAPLAACAQEKGRTLLMAGSIDRVPAGERFLERLGAQRGLASHTNQLLLADLDRQFLRAYREEGEKRGKNDAGSDDFEITRYDSPLPEEMLLPLTEFFNTVSNDVPRGDLDMEPFQLTVDQVRDLERVEQEAGGASLFLFARERATGAIAGGTMMTWRRHTPQEIHQGITGVLPAFRGRGLGRRLKARMLEILLDERPAARFVRTNNADSNAAMLAINHALGFRPYRSETFWQIPTDRILSYLGERGA